MNDEFSRLGFNFDCNVFLNLFDKVVFLSGRLCNGMNFESNEIEEYNQYEIHPSYHPRSSKSKAVGRLSSQGLLPFLFTTIFFL